MKSIRIFEGKVALITGGSRGIGRAITLRLAAGGASVIINYLRNRQAAELTAQEARSNGVEAEIIRANVGDPEKIDAMFKVIRNKFGKLDIFVNNAASGVARPALELDEQAWDWTMNINARAFLLCARAAVILMPRGGTMIAISSLGANLVFPRYASVGVSKAALEALTRYLAIELAPKDIRVNAIAASAVDTDSLKIYSSGADRDKESWRSTPSGRMVKSDDIAGVVDLLCRDDAKMICGQTLIVDGGWSLSHDMFGNEADHHEKS
jgi:enoyl-[acyl-carrier protein] reductase III